MQVCDLAGVPRELASDADRILPGEGDFDLGPIVRQLRAIGYDGWVSLELFNPTLWQVKPSQSPNWDWKPCSACCGKEGRMAGDILSLARFTPHVGTSLWTDRWGEATRSARPRRRPPGEGAREKGGARQRPGEE